MQVIKQFLNGNKKRSPKKHIQLSPKHFPPQPNPIPKKPTKINPRICGQNCSFCLLKLWIYDSILNSCSKQCFLFMDDRIIDKTPTQTINILLTQSEHGSLFVIVLGRIKITNMVDVLTTHLNKFNKKEIHCGICFRCQCFDISKGNDVSPQQNFPIFSSGFRLYIIYWYFNKKNVNRYNRFLK